MDRGQGSVAAGMVPIAGGQSNSFSLHQRRRQALDFTAIFAQE
jgi:hypothetical protein